ncbi:MAG: hypothetical protein LAP21_10845 [Acidobacteriia bacterium]|nr:hypothetical protein [Terriglobia bacterium]
MKILDWLCAIVVFAMGIVHCALMPVIYRPFSLPALWSLGTGLSWVFAGMLNVLRLKGPGSPLLHLFSIVANAGGLLVAVLIALKVNLAQNPQGIVLLIAFAGELLSSLARRK